MTPARIEHIRNSFGPIPDTELLELCDLAAEAEQLRSAIVAHRSQKADDRCIEDDDRLYSVLGDGIKCDRRVGDKAAMLENCKRFIERRCESGNWKSYAELESEVERLSSENALQAATINGLRLPRTDWDGELLADSLARLRSENAELRQAACSWAGMFFECPKCHGRHFGTHDAGAFPVVKVCHDEHNIGCVWRGTRIDYLREHGFIKVEVAQ